MTPHNGNLINPYISTRNGNPDIAVEWGIMEALFMVSWASMIGRTHFATMPKQAHMDLQGPCTHRYTYVCTVQGPGAGPGPRDPGTLSLSQDDIMPNQTSDK